MQELPFIAFAYDNGRLGFDLTFCSSSCGRIHVWSRPYSLTKDRRGIRQTTFAGSTTHAAYDTVSGRGDAYAPSNVRACDQVSYSVTQGLSVGHVLFLTIHPHPSEKEREEETGPVQINYSNHLEDSENERRGRKESGTQQRAVGTRSVTLTFQYDHCLCNAA